VALVAESFLPKVDGVSKTAYLALRYLQRTGREVLILAPNTAPNAVGDSRVVRLPSFGPRFYPESRLALPVPLISRELEAFQPDLIHVFSPALASTRVVAHARHWRVPLVATYQTDLPAYARYYGLSLIARPVQWWLRYEHRRATLTLTPSPTITGQLREDGYRRLRPWARGVHTQHFHPRRRSDAMRARLLHGRNPNSLLCLYVGRLSPEKRVDLLLELARTPGIALTVVGDGPRRAELEREFAGTGAHFAGYLHGDALAEAYASADVFVFPGVTETFGQVVQEAQASGLPVLTVDRGGVRDLVLPGESGLVLPPDPHAFAQAAVTLRDDPALRDRMSAAARRRAECAPWEAILGQLEAHYREAATLMARYNRRYPQPPARLRPRTQPPLKDSYA
jgi:glycosyltransferase involved in cell wall biosynthesis